MLTLNNFSVTTIMIAIMVSGCRSEMKVQSTARAGKGSASAFKLNPISAKPGQMVSIIADGLTAMNPSHVVITSHDGSITKAALSVVSETEAHFSMPKGVALGLTNVRLAANDKAVSNTQFFIADLPENSLDIFIGDAGEICNTKKYIDRYGATQTGTKNCSAPTATSAPATIAKCSTSGEQNCIASGAFYAGQKCSESESNCFIPNYASGTQDLKALNQTTLSAIDPWNVRAGKSVAGVTGKLKVNCRNGAKASWDLGPPLNPTVDTTADTLTYANHGLVDGNPIWFEGGTAPGGTAGYGVYYVVNATTNTFQVAATSGGTPIDLTSAGSSWVVMRYAAGTMDLWDTVDDSAKTGSPWTADNSCGGVETVAGDTNVWKDVTSTVCDSAGDQCRYKDKITNLDWSEVQTSTNWGSALLTCKLLTFDSKSDWRLPTQKELMEAYNHGILSAANANWITAAQMTVNFWSSTHNGNSTHGWLVTLSNGYQNNTWWTYINGNVVCVRTSD